jgi:hypothetical protein
MSSKSLSISPDGGGIPRFFSGIKPTAGIGMARMRKRFASNFLPVFLKGCYRERVKNALGYLLPRFGIECSTFFWQRVAKLSQGPFPPAFMITINILMNGANVAINTIVKN